jgi:hypothetical protein
VNTAPEVKIFCAIAKISVFEFKQGNEQLPTTLLHKTANISKILNIGATCRLYLSSMVPQQPAQ